MPSWLISNAPQTFDEISIPKNVCKKLKAASLSLNPPHLLITGPAGVGKTISWKLYARQILGPGWKSTTHVLQCRDLVRQRGAMGKFEEFLKPGGNSSDTLAGMLSLDSFDREMIKKLEGDVPPAGKEIEANQNPISRLIILEDADYLGHIRQSYLRRMMETVGNASRFILVTRAPSRIIDALRSRAQMIRIPSTEKNTVLETLENISKINACETDKGVLEDITYISDGNLRKAIFILELLDTRKLSKNRSAVHNLVQASTLQSSRHLLEMALRGAVVEWRWENRGGKKRKILSGAISEIDNLMNNQGLDADDIINQLHDVIVGRRLSLPDTIKSDMLEALAICDAAIRRSTYARIHFENFLHKVAKSGKHHGLAFG
ncbi:MAG: AAA family ATPase [Candidatus Poseidoniales archaeon]|nr:MAG: AAA family ATPase [Candidatus Poseidoniales archaeon]